MASPKKLLFIIIPTAVFFTLEQFSIADNDWQLNDSSIEISDTEEIELGKQVDKYIRYQFYLENDPALNTAVSNITERIASVSDRNKLPFTCTILQSNSINAFSAPGGYIYLTYGLLKFAKTKDEVACIIGHEIAHASLRHTSKLYYEIKNFLSHQGDRDTSDKSLLLLISHIEEFEQDADTVGVLYAFKSGFDPNGLPDFLERHLALAIREGIFGILGFGSSLAINTRIDHLREYTLTLEKKR